MGRGNSTPKPFTRWHARVTGALLCLMGVGWLAYVDAAADAPLTVKGGWLFGGFALGQGFTWIFLATNMEERPSEETDDVPGVRPAGRLARWEARFRDYPTLMTALGAVVVPTVAAVVAAIVSLVVG